MLKDHGIAQHKAGLIQVTIVSIMKMVLITNIYLDIGIIATMNFL